MVKGVTAKELVDRLESDPGYQRRMDVKRRQLAAKAAAFQRAEQPVIRDLQEAGYHAASLNDLANTRGRLPEGMIPTLLAWVSRIEDKSVLEMLIRALSAAPKRSFNGSVLAERFDRAEYPDDELRWVIANTIEAALPTHVTEWVARTIQISRYEATKGLLCEALVKMMPKEEALPIVLSVFDQCPESAAVLLRKFGTVEHLEFLRSQESIYIEKASSERKGTLPYNAARLALREIQKAIAQIRRRGR